MEKYIDTEEDATEEDFLSLPSGEIDTKEPIEDVQRCKISKNQRMSETEMEIFCQHLHDFIQQIQSLDQIKNIYEYSRELGERLEADVNELRFLLLEVNAVNRDIQRMRFQRMNLKTEAKNIRRMFTKTKQQELNEMELVIAVYDKDILRKWHTAKRSNNINSLEAFIAEMNGKREATEYAIKMAKERLQNIDSTPRCWNGTPVKAKPTTLNSIPLNFPSKNNNILNFM